jgi:hypothetical protein
MGRIMIGIYQLQLLVQPRKAGGTLLCGGGTIPRGPAADNVANEEMLLPVESTGCEDLVQQDTRRAYERSPYTVFISSRCFTDDEDGSMMISLTENEVVP